MYLNFDDIRNFMLDRAIEDNELDMDLTYSDEELSDAMRRAARETNDVPPYKIQVTADKLPEGSNIWLYAVAEQLTLSRLERMMRSDIEYQAEGVLASVTAKRIKHAATMVKVYRERWLDPLRRAKMGVNVTGLHYYGN